MTGRPVRVLAIGNLYPPAAVGGYERIFRGAVLALRAAGHEVEVLTTAVVPGREVEAELDPGIHRELGWYWRDFGWPELAPRERLALERRNRRALRRHLRRLRPDVVAWWAMGGMSLSLVEQVRRAGVPALGLVADEWMGYGPAKDWWLETWRWHPREAGVAAALTRIPTSVRLADAARWLFISEYLRDRAAEALDEPLPDTGILRPGVDPSRFPVAPPRPWEGRLLYSGRVEQAKGVHVAVAALAHLPQDVTLTVDGPANDEYAGELRATAEALGVAGRLTLTRSPTDRIHEAYAAADAVLFPNLWNEPWGLVPLEAMAVGRPVIGTATGGSAEFMHDGRTCLRVARDDPAALAQAVLRLAGDEPLRDRLVAAGRETVAALTEEAFEQGYVEEVQRLALRSARPAV